MKTLLSIAFASVLGLILMPVQAGTVANQNPIVKDMVVQSEGDGIDSRHCAKLKKMGKKPADMCF
ncbi:hypothetical protein [Zobellella maritima]|uniref:hypothetical protein n=1 Tax=Zobellella maritima TaxID=2059725 RepID=UPI000E3090A6|nr:hypothetical protein [Zobellella maritima]